MKKSSCSIKDPKKPKGVWVRDKSIIYARVWSRDSSEIAKRILRNLGIIEVPKD